MEEFIKIAELQPNKRRISLRVRVLNLGEKKEIVSRRTGEVHRIVEAILGDDSGTVVATLWDEKANRLEEGKTYYIKNANTSVFKGSLRLNVGHYTEVEESDIEIAEEDINKENNISDVEIEYKPRGGYRGYGRYY